MWTEMRSEPMHSNRLGNSIDFLANWNRIWCYMNGLNSEWFASECVCVWHHIQFQATQFEVPLSTSCSTVCVALQNVSVWFNEHRDTPLLASIFAWVAHIILIIFHKIHLAKSEPAVSTNKHTQLDSTRARLARCLFVLSPCVRMYKSYTRVHQPSRAVTFIWRTNALTLIVDKSWKKYSLYTTANGVFFAVCHFAVVRQSVLLVNSTELISYSRWILRDRLTSSECINLITHNHTDLLLIDFAQILLHFVWIYLTLSVSLSVSLISELLHIQCQTS